MKRSLLLTLLLIMFSVSAVFAQGPSITIKDKSRIESDDLRHIVELSGTSTYDVYYTFSTSDGSASAGSDYVAATNQQVIIPAGVTIRHAVVDVIDDNSYENDETLTVTITDAWLDDGVNTRIPIINSSATGTIEDDDAVPSISIRDKSQLEDFANELRVVVTLSNPTAFDVYFAFSTSDGSALVSDNDYTPLTNQQVMIKGDVNRVNGHAVVEMIDDTFYENDETLTVTLTNAYLDDGNNTGIVITNNVATGTILNDDAMPIVSFKKEEFSKKEGNQCEERKPYTKANLKVVLDKPATGWEEVTVHLRTNPAYRSPGIVWKSSGLPNPDIDDTMDGWDDKDVLVSFARGEIEKNVPIKIIRDCEIEENEFQQFILLYGNYLEIDGSKKVSSLLIKNDDCEPVAEFTADVVEGVGELEVQFTNQSTCAKEFLWDFGDGTTSSDENPAHKFKNPPHKYYTVTLTAYSADCCDRKDMIAKNNYITVHKEANVAFNAMPIVGIPGTEVEFMNKSAGSANKFTWYFGDGTMKELQHSVMEPVNPKHIYENEGSYTIKLKGEGHGGVDMVEVKDLIYIDEYALELSLKEYGETLPGEGWENAINQDVISPAASVQAVSDDAWAVFSFADMKGKMIHKVRVLANNAFGSRYKNHLAKDFEIHVSMDGENYELGYAGTLETKYDWEVFEFDAVAANYIKLKLVNARGENSPYITLGEFQVFGMDIPDARVQVIHNAADPVADSVDVYLNGGLLLDNFAFRTAIPFTSLPALVKHEIGIAPKTAESYEDVIAKFDVVLDPGEKYVVVANGVLTPDAFAENPDGKDTAFTLFVKTMAQEEAMTAGNVEFAVLHGSTDAPTVDVYARDVAQLVDDAAYGDITEYLSVPAADYTLDITDATGTVNVVSYLAPLAGLADGAAFVFASGFFVPDSNNNGPAFGVFAALADGSVLELPVAQSASESINTMALAAGAGTDLVSVPTDFALLQNYPNPFNPETTINYQLPEAADVVISIYNVRGQLIRTLVNSKMNAGYHSVVWNGSNNYGNEVAGGMYIFNIRATSENNESFNVSRKMLFMK